MERINPEKAEKAVKLYMKQLGLETKFKQYRILKTFNEIIGETALKHIKTKNIQGRKLFVYMDSAIARNQIFMQRNTIVKTINEMYGEYILEEIILN